MRQQALRCVLSAKAGDSELKILEDLNFEEPKTKEMARILTALGASSSALVVTGGADSNVVKSARNLPGIKTLPASLLNVVDLLSCQLLLMTEAAVRKAEQLWGEKEAPEVNNASV